MTIRNDKVLINYLYNMETLEVFAAPRSRNWLRKHQLAFSYTCPRYWKFVSRWEPKQAWGIK